MDNVFVTNSTAQTQKLGQMLAKELHNGQIICLTGELGSGKTTFTQGLLKGLKAKGPYTSPTFIIMKKYGSHVYHVDAYRVNADDMINLGWEEIAKDKKNIIIVEWAERIKKIVPPNAVWVKFEWIDENKRKIFLKSK